VAEKSGTASALASMLSGRVSHLCSNCPPTGRVPIFPVRLRAKPGVKWPSVSTSPTDPLGRRTATAVSLPHFQHAWDQYVQQHYIDRDDRQRQYGAGKSKSTLVHMEDKLLFILYYVKVYPLQEIPLAAAPATPAAPAARHPAPSRSVLAGRAGCRQGWWASGVPVRRGRAPGSAEWARAGCWEAPAGVP
jgi:hypothetical protein